MSNVLCIVVQILQFSFLFSRWLLKGDVEGAYWSIVIISFDQFLHFLCKSVRGSFLHLKGLRIVSFLP